MNSIGDALAASRTYRAIRSMAAAVVLGAALVALPWTAPRAAAIGPLPACRIADVLTVPDD